MQLWSWIREEFRGNLIIMTINDFEVECVSWLLQMEHKVIFS